MLLRRIATALKQQDWATVLIEFALVVFGVVFGVVIALQTNNWNSGRQEYVDEQFFIGRLHAEVLTPETIYVEARRISF